MSVYLFDPKVLARLDFQGLLGEFVKCNPHGLDIGDLFLRPLKSDDYQYVQLLRQLTVVGDIGDARFCDTFATMACCRDTYLILVLENTKDKEIVAAATLLIELKFIHNCSKRGHIEDVVVDSKYRGKNIGHLLLECLVRLAKHYGCYKVSLDCKDPLVPFYAKAGFSKENNIMYLRLGDPDSNNHKE